MSLHQPIRRGARVTRSMSLMEALHWAFQAEKAQLDFDQLGAHEFDRPGVDVIWILEQRARLGVTVDGGGTSDPHRDAQIIAAAVEALPENLGGRRMALQIAELARAGSAPDWGQGDRLGVVPCGWEWDEDEGRWMAGTAKAGSVWVWRDSRSRKREHQGEVCAISFTGTAAGIAAKRRNYLAWYAALLELQWVLRQAGLLDTVEVTGALPPVSPWHG